MAHEFVIIRKGKQETYTRYEDIPLDFDHVIKFIPETPPPPHTEEQHEEIESWMDRVQKLMDIEKARWNK
jgi:hypothetical protein